MKKIKCQNCGKEINKNDKYCDECGILIKKEERQNKFLSILIAVVLTIILCLIAFAFVYNFYLKNLTISKTIKEVTVTDKGIAEAVDKVYDSVVVVENYINGNLVGTGTGFVFKTDNTYGYILTNYHVTENATELRVIFTNNEKVVVSLVGSDEYSDIAVLKVSKDKVLKVADLGSSEDLKVGDTAFAVGAPIDASAYSWTVTRGIISGKNREIEVATSNYSNQSYMMEVLQTDAAINSGNSGGPLCNANGEVIGITNLKLAASTVEGMGFAIPIEIATKYGEKIIEGKKIERPYLGISIYEAIEKTTNKQILYVNSVEPNSASEKAGLQKGDIITKINDVEVKSSTQFKYQLYKYEVGETITITIIRNDKEQTLKVELKESL